MMSDYSMTRQMTLNHWMNPPLEEEWDAINRIDFEFTLSKPTNGYWIIKLPYRLWYGSLIQMDCENDTFIL